MKRLALAISLSVFASSAWAQNPTCPTRPSGDNTNACASTAFVQNAVGGSVPLAHTHIFVGNGSNVAANYGTLATFSDTGTLSLNPTTGFSLGYDIAQTLSGSTPAAQIGTFLGYAANRILVNNNSSYSSSIFGLHVELDTSLAGSSPGNAAGFFHTISGAASGSSGFAIGTTHYVSVETNWLGGTLGVPAGAAYGLSVYSRMGGAPIIHLLNLTGMEINPEAGGNASSTVDYKSGIQIALLQNDSHQGISFDAALSISNIAGSTTLGWRDGILFSTANGQQPLDATNGTLIKTRGAGTVLNGFDISSYTITGNAFVSTNFSIGGTGLVSAFRYNNVTITTPASPATLTIIQGTTVTGPATSDTLVGRATTDTLTNKSISGSTNTLTSIANASLVNSATTVNGQTCTLGSTCTITATATAITVGTTTITSGTTNGLLYNNTGVLGNLASANSGVLVTSGGGIPSISTTLPNVAHGTPTSITLTNGTGLPIAGITGLGTGVATALAVNVGSAGAFVTFNGVLGTPSSGTVTNLTGTASININGTVGATTPATGTFTTLIGTSGTIAGLTGLAIRDTSAAFDVTIAATSSGVLSAGRTLTLNMGNVAHTLALGTTANTITFPNAASFTVAGLSIANAFTAQQTITATNDGLTSLSGNAGLTGGISVGRASLDAYFVGVGAAIQFNPSTLQGDTIIRAASRLLLDGSNGGTGAVVISATNTITLPNVASDTAATDNTLCITSAGLVLKGSGTLGICLGTSSERYKNRITDLKGGIEEIMQLRPVNFYYNKDKGHDTSKIQFGFTAEQVYPILPALVDLDDKHRPNTVDILGMFPIMVKAMQDLKGDNDNLRSQLVELRNRK